jgi:dTDP-4-amino-4,6-dideoxygalactose transaminase
MNTRAQYAPLLPELNRRIAEVVEDGRFILGPNVQAFEQEAADYLGVAHTIGVANGTDALMLALDGLGRSSGGSRSGRRRSCPSTSSAARRRSRSWPRSDRL